MKFDYVNQNFKRQPEPDDDVFDPYGILAQELIGFGALLFLFYDL